MYRRWARWFSVGLFSTVMGLGGAALAQGGPAAGASGGSAQADSPRMIPEPTEPAPAPRAPTREQRREAAGLAAPNGSGAQQLPSAMPGRWQSPGMGTPPHEGGGMP